MAKNPVSSFNEAKMGEDAAYVHKNIIDAMKNVETILSSKLSQSDIQPILTFVTNIQDAFGSVENLMNSINLLADENDKLKTALRSLAAKLDADSADTGGDSDYESSVNSDL